MQNEAIRLSIKFFEEIKRFNKDTKGRIAAKETYKVKVMENITSLLAGGISSKQLESLMDRYEQEHNAPYEAYNMDDILKYFGVLANKGTVKHDPDNLLESGKFYYHPRLQKTPPAPVIEILPDGTFKSSYEEEEFYLEVIERFTLDDMTNYFYDVMGVQEGKRYLKRDKGAFKSLLDRYQDLDLLLFAVKESVNMAEDLNRPKPRHPFEVEDYIEDGRAILEERKNLLFMEGLDHVIPR